VLLGGITAATSLAVWNNLYGTGKVSSTAVIAFVVVPVYATGAAIAAFLLAIGVVAARSLRGPLRPDNNEMQLTRSAHGQTERGPRS